MHLLDLGDWLVFISPPEASEAGFALLRALRVTRPKQGRFLKADLQLVHTAAVARGRGTEQGSASTYYYY